MEPALADAPVRDFREPHAARDVHDVGARPDVAQLRPVLRAAARRPSRSRTKEPAEDDARATGRRRAGLERRAIGAGPRPVRSAVALSGAATLVLVAVASASPGGTTRRSCPTDGAHAPRGHGVAVPRPPRRRVRRVRRRPRAGSSRRAGPRRARARRGDPARPARGAAAPLDRRVDVLGVRLDRERRRRQPVRRSAGGRSRRARRPPTWARDWRDTTTVYGPAFTLLSEPRGARSPAPRPTPRPGSSRRSRRPPCSSRPRRSPAAARRPALAVALVGWNPVLAVHLAGGGHNDALVGGLAALGRRAGGAPPCGARAVSRGRSRSPSSGCPLLFLAVAALAARAARGRPTGLAAAAATGVAVGAVATLALRPRLAAGARAARRRTRRARRATRFPPARAARAAGRRRARPRGRGARGGARAGSRGTRARRCRASAAPPASCSRRRPTSPSGTSRGRCRSPPPTRTASHASPRSRSGRTSCRRRSRSEPQHEDVVLVEDDLEPAARAGARRGARGTAAARCCRRGSSRGSGRRRPSRASRSTGKLKTRRRSERCAPSVFVALTGASGGIRRDGRARPPRPGR